MEPGDVLADDVDVRRPERLEPLLVAAVADRRDVVQQGVEPDVDRLLGVERDRDAPGEPFAGDRDVLQTRLHEVDDLVPAALGLDEVGVRLVIGEQAVAEGREPEEVILLLDLAERDVGVVRAAAVDQLLLGLERLAAVAVKARVRLLVDVPGVVDRLDELPAARVVARLAGLDEVVERDLERLPDLLELAGHVVDVGLGLDPELLGALRDLDRVLVVAHLEVDGRGLPSAGTAPGRRPRSSRRPCRCAAGCWDNRSPW